MPDSNDVIRLRDYPNSRAMILESLAREFVQSLSIAIGQFCTVHDVLRSLNPLPSTMVWREISCKPERDKIEAALALITQDALMNHVINFVKLETFDTLQRVAELRGITARAGVSVFPHVLIHFDYMGWP